ncbi:MAG: hypothetical protein AB1728_11340 [Bacteroidota bacterium]
MKEKISSERRKFFTKFGIGTLSVGILNIVPFKLFASPKQEKKNSEQSVSISINPMAVKRTKKG